MLHCQSGSLLGFLLGVVDVSVADSLNRFDAGFGRSLGFAAADACGDQRRDRDKRSRRVTFAASRDSPWKNR
jgi:hypothetical protein